MNRAESSSTRDESLRLRVPFVSGRLALKAYFTDASQRLLVDQRTIKKAYGQETATKELMAHPLAQEIMRNDGTVTYLMHSTNIERAEIILRDGVRLERNRDDPTTPNLRHTTKMMPSSNEPGARKRIEHGMTYRYGVGGNNAKIVIQFDKPNPGTSLRVDQFEGTDIIIADEVHIMPTADTSHPYKIPASNIMGYFNLDTGVFVPNEPPDIQG